MDAEGKYIYCIIGTSEDRSFGPIGIGGRAHEVITVGFKDLSMVVSNSPMSRYVVSRENILAHQRVVEEVMKEYTVLPVRFCTIAGTADEIRNLIHKRHAEFKTLLEAMRHKVELGVKAIWNNMDEIFKEIVNENPTIKKLKETLEKHEDKPIQVKLEVGRLVEQALKRKKELEAEAVVPILKKSAVDCRINKTFDIRMFLNASFLTDSGRQMEFDNIMNDLSDGYKERAIFKYVGALPPYNFANITIYPEEWER